MAEVLEAIVELRRAHVAAHLRGRHFDPPPTRLSLKQVLDRPGSRFIMEVSCSSSGKHRGLHTPGDAARACAPMANAVSLLNDSQYLGGSTDDVATVRKNFDGPILARDFFVDPVQVREARAAGADAIVIMLSVLDDENASKVRAEADRLGMDVIYEVHDEVGVDRALRLAAQIIGINNRNSKTLDIDLATTERLASFVPEDVTLISESGICSVRDVRRLSRNVDALLVGPSLMASKDIVSAARELIFGPVKICGLTRTRDVMLSGSEGATHSGFIFVHGSPRGLGLVEAEPLIASARANSLKTVGVFQNSTVGKVAAIANCLGLDAVQLHGKEDSKYIASLREKLIKRTEIWGVCPVAEDVIEEREGIDRTLFDSSANGKSGGTGKTFDWSIIAGRTDLAKALLAGGIRPDNARLAIELGAYGLDICSGVEAAPGVKCEGKMRSLFRALRPLARGE